MTNSQKIQKLEAEVQQLRFELSELRKLTGIKEIEIYDYLRVNDPFPLWCYLE